MKISEYLDSLGITEDANPFRLYVASVQFILRIVSAHAICIAILEGNIVKLIEPQTDRIYNPDSIVSSDPSIDTEKIRAVQS